jgi:hypothetical protein
MKKNIIKQEECSYCKWYDQDSGDYELRLESYQICTATNNTNKKKGCL